MDTDPLADLLAALEATGELPPGWAERYAPDGDLRRHWTACRTPRTVLRLGAWYRDRMAPARAACACARLAAAHDTTAAPVVGPLLDMLEAWIAAPKTPMRTVRAALPPVDALVGKSAGARAALAALSAAQAANGASDRPTGAVELAAVCAADAVANASGADSGQAWFAAWEDAGAAMADLIRAHVPCPTLDQLRAAFTRG